MENNERLNSNEVKLSKVILILLKGFVFCSLLINSTDILAESSRNAFGHTFKAMKKTPQVRDFIQAKKYKIDHQLKQATELIGDNLPVIVALGVLAKLAVDGNVGYKTKISDNTSYNVNLNVSGEITSGINGKIETIKDSSYDVIAYSKGNDQGMRVGLKFNFD